MIDRRLFPLLETLAASRLDWLMRDVMVSIELGDQQVETENALSSAHERIRLNEEVRSESENQASKERSTPWTGDEQVALAADIVMTRLKETLLMAEFSIESVSRLIGAETREVTTPSNEGVAVLGDDGEVEASMDEQAVRKALEGMDQLRLAIEEWKSVTLRGSENT
ncbi:hypothetical protein OO012_11160 [Rhodobacteraceae bacterium KMM 6894]|nr:hypothetical protein [Rhodobacteraceae bacterium KMM 6894]